jgi:hypothetical protein
LYGRYLQRCSSLFQTKIVVLLSSSDQGYETSVRVPLSFLFTSFAVSSLSIHDATRKNEKNSKHDAVLNSNMPMDSQVQVLYNGAAKL